MKTYVITISQNFPKTHKRAGEQTNFIQAIHTQNKIHTIRANYELWAKRFEKIDKGEAFLSVRIWEGMPYRSKQKEVFRYYNIRNIGVEKLEHPDNFVFAPIEGKQIDWEVVAKNDGLNFDDFCEWFKSRQKESMAIIHFTGFRYINY